MGAYETYPIRFCYSRGIFLSVRGERKFCGYCGCFLFCFILTQPDSFVHDYTMYIAHQSSSVMQPTRGIHQRVPSPLEAARSLPSLPARSVRQAGQQIGSSQPWASGCSHRQTATSVRTSKNKPLRSAPYQAQQPPALRRPHSHFPSPSPVLFTPAALHFRAGAEAVFGHAPSPAHQFPFHVSSKPFSSFRYIPGRTLSPP